MRYAETGEIHKDFHLATDASIRYALTTYGSGFLEELFRRTAQDVYADIHKHLCEGDVSALVEHWRCFLEREGGVFSLTEEAEGIRLHVRECPAARHLKERGRPVSEDFHLQTILMHRAWAQDTPFDISTQVLGDCECITTLRRKADAAE